MLTSWLLCTAAVSRAYSCLSDPNKRAHYDRYGQEDTAQLSRRGQAGPGMYNEGFDPNELFNMFFGGGFPAGARYGPRMMHNRP